MFTLMHEHNEKEQRRQWFDDIKGKQYLSHPNNWSDIMSDIKATTP